MLQQQVGADLKGADDDHWLAGGCSEAQFDLRLHFCLPSHLISGTCSAEVTLEVSTVVSAFRPEFHLGVMDEALAIPGVGWQLTSTSLLQALNNGLHPHGASAQVRLQAAKYSPGLDVCYTVFPAPLWPTINVKGL